MKIDFRLDGIRQYTITVSGKYSNSLEASSSDIGTIKKIENYVDSIPERYESHKRTLERYQEELVQLKENIDKPFKLQNELDKLTKEVDNLNTELGITKTADVDDMIDDMDDSFKDTDSGEDSYYRGDSDDIWRQTERDSDEPVKIKKTPSLQDLKKGMERRFEIPVSTGKVGDRSASGVHRTKADTIRTKTSNDLPTMAHELGHHFDKKYDLSSSDQIDKVVTHFADSLYKKGYETEDFDSEAIAEYFREYLTDTAYAVKLFPEFAKYIEKTFDKKDFKNLREFAAESNAYFASDIEARDKARIRSRADDSKIKDTVKAVKENPASAAKMAADTFAMNWVDKYSPIKRVDRDINKSDRLYTSFLLADTVKINVMTALTDGVYDFDGIHKGDSLKDAIIEAGVKSPKDAAEFDRYLINRRALELSKYGIRTSADEQLQNPRTMEKTITDIESKYPDFRDGADKVYEFERNILQFAVDSGLMTQKFAEKLWDKYPDYVPMFRAIEKNTIGYTAGTKAKSGVADQKSPIKRVKGSGLDIYSPIESIAVNTSNIMTAAKRNGIMIQFADMIDNNENTGYIAEKVSPDMIQDAVPLASVKKKVIDGLSDENAKRMLENFTEEEKNELISTILQSMGDTQKMYRIKGQQKPTVVSVMRIGEPVYYEIHDKNILKVLKNMNPSSMGVAGKIFGTATHYYKMLTTGNSPYFMAPNMISDFPTGFINSDTSHLLTKYTYDYLKSAYNVIRQTESYKNYVRNGGGYSGSVTSNINVLKKTMRELKNPNPKSVRKIAAAMRHVGDTVGFILSIGEDIPRYAEYERTLKKTNDIQKAQMAAREVTVNFPKKGLVAEKADKLSPYLAANIGGTSKAIETLFTDTKEKGLLHTLEHWRKLLMLGGIAAMIIAAVRKFFNENGEGDEAYEDLSTNYRYNYVSIIKPDGTAFRLKKPQGLYGLVMTSMEESANKIIFDDEDAFYNFGSYILDTFVPEFRPIILSTVFELAKNESWNNAPIVPLSMQNLDKSLQYDENTSIIAVKIGQITEQSPKQIDYILKQNTGFIGRGIGYIAPMSGNVDKTLGFGRLLTADSVYSNDIISKFYASKERYDTYAASYRSTDGKDSKYRYSDVYNSYKYGKYASLYSDLNKSIKATDNADTQREMRRQVNDIIKEVNRTGETPLDKKVMALSEKYGIELSEIAPYVNVPDTIKGSKQTHDANVTYVLNFDEKIGYFKEAQARFDYWYGKILRNDLVEGGEKVDLRSAEKQIEYMKKYKGKIQTNLRQNYKQIIITRANAKAG